MRIDTMTYGRHIQFLAFVILLEVVKCLQVIPEKSNVTFFNPKEIGYALLSIKRYSRKSAYYINAHGSIKHSWNNNVTMHFVFYEYLHNEYRRSFVEMHYKFCDLINKDPYIGGMFRKNGIICPAPPREYNLMNMTVPTENFPNVFPFEKGRINIEFTLTESGESILVGYLDATFKPTKSKMKP